MSLDLAKTAIQIERMADDMRSRRSDLDGRLNRARRQVESFDTVEYEAKRARSSDTLNWTPPRVDEDPSARFEPPSIPDDFCVAAVDGSHIDVDRHLPARCCLVNIGSCVLTYGSAPGAVLSSLPTLYASDEELTIRSRSPVYQEQPIQGSVLSSLRAVEEMRALVDVVRGLPSDLPTLALMDGTLMMYLGRGTQLFVIEELVGRGLVRALDELRELASDRRLAVASYISLPGSSEFTSALRVRACPYEVSDCRQHCGDIPSGGRPCDEVAEGLLDREVFSAVLTTGQRSAVFRTSNSLVQEHYGGHGVSFFYLNVGEEMGRVEVPSWVAEDEALLGLAHLIGARPVQTRAWLSHRSHGVSRAGGDNHVRPSVLRRSCRGVPSGPTYAGVHIREEPLKAPPAFVTWTP